MAKLHLELVAPATVKQTVTPRRLPNGDLRTREYLTEAESTLLGNKVFVLPGQMGDAIPYFRPPLKPTGIHVRDIVVLTAPANFTVSAYARLRRAIAFSLSVLGVYPVSRPYRRMGPNGPAVASDFNKGSSLRPAHE
jgi:hypothetical protein